jgi:hemoglobin
MSASLYERLGGESAMMAAVDLFYEKVVADERTRPFFAGLDMSVQIKKQVAFMTRAFDGPAKYSGRDLRSAHAPLVERGLDDTHFDAILEHLEASLRELGVAEGEIAEVRALVSGSRDEVLNR